MIKLIALDLDNTLLERDNNIHPHTLKLLRTCVANGITVVIATGRIYLSAKKYAHEIGSGCKILCYNGCLLTEADGDPLFSATLTVDAMRKIISFCKERGLYCQFYRGHRILVEKVVEETRIDPDLANTAAIEADDLSKYDLTPSPKAMIVCDPAAVPAVQKELSDFMDGEVYIAQSQPYLIEIMPEGVNKAHTLELLCEKVGISRDEVMACGDNTNDAEMIRWAGTGVAVANSVEPLKAAASYVCKAERSLGVAEAIEKFCLSEQQ